MIELDALRKQPRSLSHWGEFDCGREPVVIRACDCGIVEGSRGPEYLSILLVGSDQRESRMPVDRALLERDGRSAAAESERRMAVDMTVLASMGIDVETIDYGTIRNVR